MRVDFYQLSRDPVERALPQLARATLNAGQRMLVVSADEAQLGRISEQLWSNLPESFLAHGRADADHAERQPILLAGDVSPANGATYLALTDGVWREGEVPFARTFLLFDQATVQGARHCWKMLGERDGVERRFWEQQGGKWIEGP